jgi:hypothetical protein
MNKHITLAIVAMVFFLCGCATTSTTLPALNRAYIGKNSDDFFLRHGPPASAYQLNSGGKIYKWNSSVKSYSMPATTTHTGYATSYGTYQGTSTTTGGGSLNVYTILLIKTDEQDIIESIEIEEDTIGKWTLSRFSEIFGEYKDATPTGRSK